MFHATHLKLSLRRLKKNKVFSFINLGGLAFGFASCIIISLFVFDELSYDRHHIHLERIHRLTTHAQMGENTWNSVVVSPALGPAISEEIAEVDKVVRLNQYDQKTVSVDNVVFIEDDVLAADADFLQVFTFPLIHGDPAQALVNPHSILLTTDYAKKYFNNSSDVVGKSIMIDGENYRITGILRNIPENSHFHFDIVMSYSSLPRFNNPQWQNSNTPTYVLLNEGADIGVVNEKVMDLMERRSDHYRNILEAGFSWQIGTQPLKRIHLHSQLEDEFRPNGDIKTVYFLSLIAVFILFIAVINFINMSTAKSADRAKEIGIRKTLGTSKGILIKQFLTESTVLTVIAMILGLGLAYLLKFPFEFITGKPILSSVLQSPVAVLSIFLISLMVGLIAGIYPAFFLTRFKPVDVLSGSLAQGSSSGFLRNGLVVFQFVIAATLIASTTIIFQQLQFMKSKDLGFERDHVMLIKNADKLGSQFESFQNSILSDPNIISLGHSDFAPLDELQGSMFVAEGRSASEARIMNYMLIDPGYIPTMGIQLESGRNFVEEMGADSSSIILNQSALKSLGVTDPLGKNVLWNSPYKIIGIVEDFHFSSLEEEIGPLVFMLGKRGNVLEIKINSQDIGSTIASVENKWNEFTEGTEPIQFGFLDAEFELLYEKHVRLSQVFSSFSFLAILISCLGLFALSAFMTERRTKEIGIRKVLGATLVNITYLLSKEFTKLVIISLIISLPIVYWIMSEWLSGFSYRIALTVVPFVITGFLVILIAWITVSFHSFKAALAHPVKAIKDN